MSQPRACSALAQSATACYAPICYGEGEASIALPAAAATHAVDALLSLACLCYLEPLQAHVRAALLRSSPEPTNLGAKVKRFPQNPRCVAIHPEPGSACQR